MKPDLTLFVPGLCAPWRGENPQAFLPAPHVPALLDLLTRADRAAQPSLPFEDALARAFAVEAGDLPWGALGLWGETGERPAGFVVRLDPVHLRLGMTEAIVTAGAALPLSLAEAQELARSLEAHFVDRGWTIVVAAPQCWYVCVPDPVELETTPLSQALGHDAGVLKPQGRDARHWLADVNEAQMLLFAHPVNAAREARGLPTVNSLWPWGAGALPPSPLAGRAKRGGRSRLGERGESLGAEYAPQTSEPPLPNPLLPNIPVRHPSGSLRDSAPFPTALVPRGGREFLTAPTTAVYANHPLARGLAHASEFPVHDLPETLDECAELSGTALIVLDDLVQPFQDGDYDDWQATLEGMDARWFAPLRAALAKERVSTLQIDTGAACFVCKPAHRWRFWRRAKPLESLCSAARV